MTVNHIHKDTIINRTNNLGGNKKAGLPGSRPASTWHHALGKSGHANGYTKGLFNVSFANQVGGIGNRYAVADGINKTLIKEKLKKYNEKNQNNVIAFNFELKKK
tara:strand:+ start:1619 stop:1933 length:315 start_codon:yes stop_codon:yes gene_type:complete